VNSRFSFLVSNDLTKEEKLRINSETFQKFKNKTHIRNCNVPLASVAPIICK